MKTILILIAIALFWVHELQAQKDARMVADSIDGVYIPKNLEESLLQIDSFWSDSTKTKVASWTENEFAGKAHLGFGTWMRNNWGLWGGSRLSEYFHKKGIYHPEAMSGIILTSYHRKLTGKELEVEKQVRYYRKYWKKAKKEEKERQQKEFSKFSVGDTVDFSYAYDFISVGQEESYMNDSCNAYGIVMKKNFKDFTLLIKLLDACDQGGIISSKYDQYDRKGKLMEKNLTEVMLQGQEKWLRYEQWYLRKNY